MGAKVIICGGRDYDNYDEMQIQFTYFARHLEIESIVSGGNKSWNDDKKKFTGADYLSKRLAKEKNIPHEEFPADWQKHGKRAGYIRNAAMGEAGTHVLAFWDGKSRGTAMMIDIARRKNIPVEIIYYNQ
jgi:hypothetical protein